MPEASAGGLAVSHPHPRGHAPDGRWGNPGAARWQDFGIPAGSFRGAVRFRDKTISEMKRLSIILAAALLVAGLCGCRKENPVDAGLLPGTWCKLYPEGVVTEGGVSWSFGEDNKLEVRVYDVFAGDFRTEYVYRVEPDGRTLFIWEPMFGGDPAWAKYRMVRCDGAVLELVREDVHAKDATELEGYITWFEGDVTFRRFAGK